MSQEGGSVGRVGVGVVGVGGAGKEGMGEVLSRFKEYMVMYMEFDKIK